MTIPGSDGPARAVGIAAENRREPTSKPARDKRSSSSPQRTQARTWTGRLNIVLPGAYAWGATVAYPVAFGGGPAVAWVPCAGALAVLVWVGFRRRAPDGHPGLAGALAFFVLAGATWVLLGVERMRAVEPFQAAFGSIGWLLCALGWGWVRNSSAIPEEDPRVVAGAPLVARRRTPSRAVVYFAVAVTCAAATVIAVWMVERPAVGVLAHLVAMALASWILLVGAQLARFCTHACTWSSPRERLSAASRVMALIVLAALAVLLGRILQF